MLKTTAEARFCGVLGYTEEPLAFCDYNRDPRPGIVDASQTPVAGGRLVRDRTWFGSGRGIANRMLSVVESVFEQWCRQRFGLLM